MRFDLSSFGVMALAVASSLTAAFWLNHAGDRGSAHAETAAVAAASGVPGQVLKGRDGHYWARAVVGGRAVSMLVDTGASVVTLTPEDAARLGFHLKPADFSGAVVTASGPTRAAPIRLAAVTVAGARVEAVDALVVEHGLSHSLLGMSYLGRLSGFQASPAALILRP